MDETEAIADIFKRMDEIQERLKHERRCCSALLSSYFCLIFVSSLESSLDF